MDKNKETYILELIITGQLFLERLEEIPENLNRRKLKKATNELLRELQPISEQYNKVYLSDEELARQVVWEVDSGIKLFVSANLEEQVFISQALEAYKIDKNTVQEAVHNTIIKAGKKELK